MTFFKRNLTSSGKVSIWSHIRIAKLANPTYFKSRNNSLAKALEKKKICRIFLTFVRMLLRE